MIMNCVHLRRPQCELLFLEIMSVINSSSLIVLMDHEVYSCPLCAELAQQPDGVQTDTETLEEATAGFPPSSRVLRETLNSSDLGRA